MLLDIVMGLLVTVEVLTCVLLMVAILIQRTRSQGMGLAFGAGVGETMFGSQAGNVLTRATVVLSIIFLVNTTVLALIGTSGRERSVVETVGIAPVAPPPAMPMAGAPAPGPMSMAPDASGFGALPATPEFPPADVSSAGDAPAPVVESAPMEAMPEAVAPAAPVVEPMPVEPAPAN